MSKYTEEINEMCWSHSRLSSFEQCKYEFYLNYIVKDDDLYLSEGNYYADVGIFVHDILARIFNKIANNDNPNKLSLQEALKYYEDNYDNNILYTTKKSIMEKSFEACKEYFLNEDFKWVDKYDILGVELEVNCEIQGYRFKGYIDLLLRDKTDGRIVILDHKSSQYPLKKDGTVLKNLKSTFKKYKQQLYLYSYAVEKIYHEYPKTLCWNFFKSGGKMVSIPFKKKEFDSSISHMVNVIHKIEKEKKFMPKREYFYCTHLCNFRNCCEYKKGGHYDTK